jgi:hypothetical protein
MDTEVPDFGILCVHRALWFKSGSRVRPEGI